MAIPPQTGPGDQRTDSTVSALAQIAHEHSDVSIDALEAARVRTRRELESLRQDLSLGDERQGLDVVLTGSFARGEATRDSDCDYLVLVKNVPDHRAITEVLAEVEKLVRERGWPSPGQQGVFGDFALAAELLARIGLEGDTNVNTTRRILVLFESTSVLDDAVREDVLTQLLTRYCYDYHPSIRTQDDPVGVPRFLLNDIVRYWRMVTVDFGAKQWRSVRRDWYLRYAKLITTRKIFFAGTLAGLLLVPSNVGVATEAEDRYQGLLSYLKTLTGQSPLTRLLASHTLMTQDGKRAIADVVNAYNSFIALLEMSNTRKLLASAGDPGSDQNPRIEALKQEVEMIGHTIQRGLERVFFEEETFQQLVKRYGLL